MEPSQVATLVISITFGLVTLFCWLATAKATQKRHEDLLVVNFIAARRRGDDMNLLAWGDVRRVLDERERKERARGSTGKSILGAAVTAVVGSGDPPAMNQDDKEVSEVESVCASLHQSPASHRARSSRRRSKSPDKPAAITSPLGSTAPAWGSTRSSRESAELSRNVGNGLDDGSFLPL